MSRKFFNDCSMGRAHDVAAHLRAGVDVNARDTYNLTGLIWAARKGQTSVARVLCRSGARVNARDSRGRTALHHAVAFKQAAMARWLVARGAWISAVDAHGCTPLDIALSERDSLTVKVLRSRGGKALTSASDTPDTWSFAAQAGDVIAGRTIEPSRLALRLLADKRAISPYSPDIDELSFVFRVDGDLSAWRFEGCERLRINRKGRYITVDIGVPEQRWQVDDEATLRVYLADCVRQGTEMMIAKMEREKMAVDKERLRRDRELILRDYVARKWPKHPNLW